jgi:hypothetical protein
LCRVGSSARTRWLWSCQHWPSSVSSVHCLGSCKPRSLSLGRIPYFVVLDEGKRTTFWSGLWFGKAGMRN